MVVNADSLSAVVWAIGAGLEDTIISCLTSMNSLSTCYSADTEDFAEAILYSGTSGGADPIVLADHGGIVRDGVAIGRPSKSVVALVDLLYFAILFRVKNNDIGIDRRHSQVAENAVDAAWVLKTRRRPGTCWD